VTLSVPTSPEALLPSPYEMFQVEPELVLNVLEFLGLKMVWLLRGVSSCFLKAGVALTLNQTFVSLLEAQCSIPRGQQIQCPVIGVSRVCLLCLNRTHEVEHELLRRRADLHCTDVLGVVLNVCRRLGARLSGDRA